MGSRREECRRRCRRRPYTSPGRAGSYVYPRKTILKGRRKWTVLITGPAFKSTHVKQYWMGGKIGQFLILGRLLCLPTLNNTEGEEKLDSSKYRAGYYVYPRKTILEGRKNGQFLIKVHYVVLTLLED